MRLMLNISKKQSGPNIFMRRLLKEFHNMGIKITNKNPDIALIKALDRIPKCKYIIRVDGIYYDQPRQSRNGLICHSVKKSSACIFQSNFSKNIFNNMLLKISNSYVIHNGLEQSQYNGKSNIKRRAKNIFGCSAQWRENKRLKYIIESFINANIQDSLLYVLGKPDIIINDKRIIYVGNIDEYNISEYYKLFDYFIHICHIESCPNVVVEALSAHTPIICNNIGGTPELVGKDGIIVLIDKEFDFQYVKSMHSVSKIKYTDKITKAMIDMSNKEWNVNREDLSIQNCAQQYIKVIKNVLNS